MLYKYKDMRYMMRKHIACTLPHTTVRKDEMEVTCILHERNGRWKLCFVSRF